MSENTFWLALWISLIVGAVCIVGIAFHYNEKMNQDYIGGGYSKRMVAGYGEPVWTKD